jgi:hypothetical protein
MIAWVIFRRQLGEASNADTALSRYRSLSVSRDAPDQSLIYELLLREIIEKAQRIRMLDIESG